MWQELKKEIDNLRDAKNRMLRRKDLSRDDKILRTEQYNESINKLKFKLALVEDITKLSPDIIRNLKKVEEDK